MQPELHVDVSIYSKSFPNFGKPNIIGFIGLQNLKFAKCIEDKKVHLNLNHNIDNVKRKPADLDVKLTDLLRFLLDNERRLNYTGANTLDTAQFFCYRGLMTCVACTPYENREPWKIVAILHNGCIYLCARDTDDKIRRKQCMTDEEKKFTSWGYKFEQYMLSDGPNSEPNIEEPVDETEEFSLVFTTNLKQHRIVYGAEMDGIRCDKFSVPLPPTGDADPDEIVKYLATKEFVELKTNRHIEYQNQDRNFRRFKTKKWWCQSFLAGVNTILCGFRNDNGLVEELKVYAVRDLPKMSRKFWDPNVCFNFLETFLTYVKRCLAREIKYKHGEKAVNHIQGLPLISLLFEWHPGSPVQVTNNYCHDDDPILLDWFLKRKKMHL